MPAIDIIYTFLYCLYENKFKKKIHASFLVTTFRLTHGFDVSLAVHLSIIFLINQLKAQIVLW